MNHELTPQEKMKREFEKSRAQIQNRLYDMDEEPNNYLDDGSDEIMSNGS